MNEIQYQDTITIPVYHHYRRDNGRCWHWTSYSNEIPDEIPSDAVEINIEGFPEFPIKKLSRAETNKFWGKS